MFRNVFETNLFGTPHNGGSTSRRRITDSMKIDMKNDNQKHGILGSFYVNPLSMPKETTENKIIRRTHEDIADSGMNMFFGFVHNTMMNVAMTDHNTLTTSAYFYRGGMFSPNIHPEDNLRWVFYGTEYWFSFFYPYNLKVLVDSLGKLASEFVKLRLFWDYTHYRAEVNNATRCEALIQKRYAAEQYAERFTRLYQEFKQWLFRHYMFRHCHGFIWCDINYGAVYQHLLLMFCRIVLGGGLDKLEPFMRNNEKIEVTINNKRYVCIRPDYLIARKFDRSFYEKKACHAEDDRFCDVVHRFKKFINKYALPATNKGMYQMQVARKTAFVISRYRLSIVDKPGYAKVEAKEQGYVVTRTADEIGGLGFIAIVNANLFSNINDGNAPQPDAEFVIFGNAKQFNHAI